MRTPEAPRYRAGMSAVSGDVQVRDATIDDLDFLTWVMLEASRSQLPRGIWEYLYAIDEPTCLRFLAGAASTEAVHLFHHSLFQIAEVDGVPAAAMCGFDYGVHGPASFGTVAEQVCREQGIEIDDDFMRRLEVMMSGFPPPAVERPWVVENVATVADYRRQGLVDRLLAETIERGRRLGFEHAQIGVYLGNDRARRAYLKAGFEPVAEVRDDRWAAEIGCPGTELLVRSIA